MMNVFVPEPLKLNPESIAGRMRVSDLSLVRRLVEDFAAAAEPKSAYGVSLVEGNREGAVTIGGVLFSSRVLGRNLEEVGRVFPYVVTLGSNLDSLIKGTEDMLEKVLMDDIANHALRETRSRLEAHLLHRFGLEKISFMSPGSLQDWPLQEQRNLFSLLPGVEDALGIRLTETLMMVPLKSVSGLYFPSHGSFRNCQLCPREECKGRTAPYDEDMAREYGLLEDH